MELNLENEKEQILELIRQAYNKKDYELECIIGNNSHIDINSKLDLINILKRLKNKKPFSKYKTENRLDIYLPKDSKFSKYINRIIIKGNAIRSYCHKENLGMILSNVEFEKKTYTGKRVFVNDYGLKYNLKEEKSVSKINNNIVNELIQEWKNIKKAYRRKKIFTFFHDDGEFRIDLSTVSQSNDTQTVEYVIKNKLISKVIPPPNELTNGFNAWWNSVKNDKTKLVNIKDGLKFYNNIKESRVLEGINSVYEFEVEWLGNKNSNKIEKIEKRKEYFEKVFNTFSHIIHIIKQSIQKNLFVMSKNRMYEIIKDFEKLTKSNYTQFMPLAVDLEKKNLIKYSDENEYNNPENINVRTNYLITDKADGERNLLYINRKGECFLISREFNKGGIMEIGVILPEYANSVFDGEYITTDINGKFVRYMYLFDCYIVKGENITRNIFGTNKDRKGRHINLIEIAKYFTTSNDVMIVETKYPFQLYNKTYYSISANKVSDNEIYEVCEKILNKMNVKYGGLLELGHLFTYPTDGIIFQPLNYGVRQNKINEKVKTINGRWYRNLKWKPPHHLTIDFMVKFNKVSGSNTYNTIMINDKTYLKGSLFVKVYNTTKYDGNLEVLGLKILNEDINVASIPSDYPFIPIYPYVGTRDDLGNIISSTDKIHILMKNGAPRCSNNDIIEDGDIIECSYIDGKWIPMRNRYGKQYANEIRTTFSTWKMINSPINSQHLIGEEKMDTSDLYYKEKKDYKTRPMTIFNNFIKRDIINKGLMNKNKARVLDMACGRLGDLDKYVSNNIDMLLGIDVSMDGLMNYNGGGAIRLLKYGKFINDVEKKEITKKLIKKSLLIHGDVGRNISNGDACFDELNRYYIDVLYGRHKPQNGKLKSLYGMALNQFHLVVCNFAIHYMLDNEEKLHEFLLNIQQNLKDQGYFIGTCQDGKTILKMMGKSIVLEKRIDDDLVVKIEREDEMVNFEDNSYGQKILYSTETFYESQENLVDMDLLISECAKFDLKLIDTKMFLDDTDNMLNKFIKEKPKIGVEIENTPEFLDVLSYHRWFIFQKVDGLNDYDFDNNNIKKEDNDNNDDE